MQPADDESKPAASLWGRVRRLARRIAFLAVALGLLVALLLGGAWLLLPRLVDLDAVKARVFAEVSTRLPVRLQARKVELTLRPLPRLMLRGVQADVPGTAGVVAEAAVVTADFWSLLRGVVRIGSIRLEAPRVVILVPEVPNAGALRSLSVIGVEEQVSRTITAVCSRLPGVALSVRRGRVELFDGKRTRFWFDRLDADASLSPSSLAVAARGVASLAERLAVDLKLDADGWVGQGRVSASRLRPDDLVRYLAPERPAWATESQWSGEATLQARGKGVLTAQIGVSTPALSVNRPGRRVSVADLRVTGAVAVAGPRWEVDLKRASLSRPRIGLSGSFSWDPKARRAALAAEGSDLEVAPLRTAALTLASDVDLVRTLSDVFRAGRIPRFSISSQAPEPRRLGDLERLVLRGGLRDATLQIPGVDLPATAASGEVVLVGGTLTGSALTGRSGASWARQGRLRLGFLGPRPAFHFEADLSADLAQLRQFLPHWLPSGRVRDEIGLIDAARGNAVGRLVLGERLDELSAEVDVRRFDVAGRHRRIPFPLELRGSFGYRGNRVAVGGLAGRIGNSTVAGGAAEVTFGRVVQLRVASAQGNLVLSELYPWLLTAPAARQALREFGPPSGRLVVGSLTLSGPAASPALWDFRARGAVEGVAVQSVWFPGRLTLAGGGLEATEESLSWSDLTATLLDATAVTSGRAGLPRAGPRTVEGSLEGVVGPKAARWIGQEASVPKVVKVSRAMTVRQGRFAWTEKGTDFSGDLTLERGPFLSLELHRTRDGLTLPKIVVRDGLSDARLSLGVREGAWDLGFRGRLSGDTADALLDRSLFWCTLAEGDFRAHVRPDAPRESSATGRVRLTGARISSGTKPLVTVESATLVGSGNTLTIDADEASMGSARFSVAGRIEARPDAYRPQLTFKAEELDAKALEEAFGGPQGADGRGGAARSWQELPVDGSAAVEVGRLRYGRYAWSPLRATVALRRGVLSADVQEARVCGVSTPGRIEVGSSGVKADLTAAADGSDLGAALSCLWDRKGLATGSFRFTAKGSASGHRSELLRSASGDVAFSAEDGRIYRFGVLAKIFAVLNVTEIFRGRLPDLFHEGFGYRKINVEGVVREGKLVFRRAAIDGASERIFWEGQVDLVSREVDVTVLVAPFKTIDSILRKIPVLGYLMGGRLVAIPLRVRGNLDDPSVVPLHPADIGAGLLGVVERTLKLPLKLIQPLQPRSEPTPPAP